MDTGDMRSSAGDVLKRQLWLGTLIVFSVLFSWALACATPFAALATLAAVNMTRRDARVAVGGAWLVNQAVGYGVLYYPLAADSLGWGLAIGCAALLAVQAAALIADRLSRSRSIERAAAAFCAAFVSYECALWLTTFALPSGDEAFSWHVVLWIGAVNALALAALLVLHRIARLAGLESAPSPSAAGAGPGALA